jgi:uncharacterized Zn finger protein (UPF0148 family)
MIIARCLKCGVVLRHEFRGDVQCCACGNVRVSKNGVEARSISSAISDEEIVKMKNDFSFDDIKGLQYVQS